MSFQTDLSEFDIQYFRFLSHVRAAIQKTFAQEVQNGLTQKELADTLGVDPALVSRRLNGPGNITLKTLSELYTAMGRETLANFETPTAPEATVVTSNPRSYTNICDIDQFRQRQIWTETHGSTGDSLIGTYSSMVA